MNGIFYKIKKRMRGRLCILLCAALFFCTISACSKTPERLLSAELFSQSLEAEIYSGGDNSILTQISELCKKYALVFDPDDPRSELYNFNYNDGDATNLSDDMVTLLSVALYYYNLSEGAYDVTAHLLEEVWDFNGKPSVPSDSDISEALSSVGMENISISGNRAILKNDVTINFSGLAYGYILEDIADQMKRSGVTGAVLRLSEFCSSFGKNAASQVLYMPFSGKTERIGEIKIKNTCAVTLSLDGKYYTADDTVYNSFLDPKTGYPVETDLYSVTIICEEPVKAYALAQMCMRAGFYKSLELLKEAGGAEAVFVTETGDIRVTKGFVKSCEPSFTKPFTEHVK